MAEEILLRMVALHGLLYETGDEVEHLLRRGVRGDVVIGTGHDERLRDLAEHLELPVALEADEQHAHVRAAEVEREILALFLARRQADVRLEHLERALRGILEPLLEIVAEISRDGLELIAVDREILEDALELVLVKRHDTFSFSLALCVCVSAPA